MDMFAVGLNLLSVLVTFIILVGVLLGKKNMMNEYFPWLLLFHALTIVTDLGVVVFAGDNSLLLVVQILYLFCFAFVNVEIACFHLYVDAMIAIGKNIQRKKWSTVATFAVVGGLALVWILGMGLNWFIIIQPGEIPVIGPFVYYLFIPGALLLLVDLLRVIGAHLNEKIDKTIAIGIYIFMAIPIAGSVLIFVSKSTAALFSAMTLSYVTMYITIHVRQEQVSLEKEADDEKVNTELILSQLQPHFLYNSLTTIKYLCGTNPALAEEAVTKFTKYMRKNLDFVSNDNLIKFKEELEHTENYLWLEELRFGNNLRVEYSVDNDDFMVPPLSLQPIVENAVKHGVTKKIGGGTVSIYVRETEEFYRITVSDDGVGFEQQEIPEGKEKHIGIADVRKRISAINGSTLKVNSRIGVGTSVVYEIMKGE